MIVSAGLTAIALLAYSISLRSMTFQRDRPLVQANQALQIKVTSVYAWFEEAMQEAALALQTERLGS